MAGRGYIKLYRSLFRHEFFRPAAFSEREAFTWMIAEAAWKPRQRRFGQFFVDLERGELAASLRFLAETWDWSVGAVRGYLGRCEKEQMISTRSDKGVTVVTICNYDIYQGDDQPDDTVDDNVSAQGEHSPGTASARGQHKTEEIKHLRKEEGERDIAAPAPSSANGTGQQLILTGDETMPTRKPRLAKRRTALDPDWVLPEEGQQYARDRGWNDRVISFQFEKFKNHHISKGNLMADWPAAWRTWVGNGYGTRPPSGGGPAAPSRADSAIEGMFSDLTEEDLGGRSR